MKSHHNPIIPFHSSLTMCHLQMPAAAGSHQRSLHPAVPQLQARLRLGKAMARRPQSPRWCPYREVAALKSRRHDGFYRFFWLARMV